MSRVASVALSDTLMRYDNYLETYVTSGDRSSIYYFRVPDAWAGLGQADLDGRVMAVMVEMYNAFNEHFRQVEPSDYNYLAPTAVSCNILSEQEEGERPWLKARSPAVWEWTPCVVVADDGSYQKVEPRSF